MKNANFDPERRRWFKLGLFATAAAMLVPVTRLQGLLPALAEESVKESDPMAQALGYVESAAKVDKKKWPKFEKGQFCYNCMFYTPSEKNRGKCSIFAGRLVTKDGWCNSWAKKAG